MQAECFKPPIMLWGYKRSQGVTINNWNEIIKGFDEPAKSWVSHWTAIRNVIHANLSSFKHKG